MIKKEQISERKVFEEYPVIKAVAVMVIPTVLSQIITVVYSLADTWYVGLTENPDAIAAISFCMPVNMMLTAISNLYGIGGAAVIARAIGMKEEENAKRGFVFSITGAAITALLFSVAIYCSRFPLLMLIGGDESNIEYAVTYVLFTVVIGGLPTILSATAAHLIRATGASDEAGKGMIIGAISNIILDPICIFIFMPDGYEVIGAAAATLVANIITFLYFACYLYRNRKYSVLTFDVSSSFGNRKQLREIILNGLPSFFMISLPLFSNCFLNNTLASLGSEAVAGLGIVRKVDQLAYSVCQGITQGTLPLVAYCYASKNHKRMVKVIFVSGVCTESISILSTVISQIFSTQLVQIFIRDGQTVQFGSNFLKVISLTVPIYTLTFVIISVLQATGYSFISLIISFVRRGTIDICAIFVLRNLLGAYYSVWSSFISESVGLLLAVIVLVCFMKKLVNKNEIQNSW